MERLGQNLTGGAGSHTPGQRADPVTERCPPLFRTCILLLAILLVAILLAPPLLESAAQIPRNYNEGWNALHAGHALGSGSLYPPLTALYANNYPPLSFYVVAAAGSLVGDNIMAGRLLSLVGVFVVALCIGLIVQRLGGSRLVAACCGLIFAGYMAAYHADYVGMNDPQLLAHAVMLAGFVVLLGGRRERVRLVLAAVLMIVAGMMKHNLVALPVALTLWMLVYERAMARFWLVVSLLLVVMALAGLYAVYGTAVFDSLLMNPRVYWIKHGMEKFSDWTRPLLVYLSGALLLLFAGRNSRDNMLITLYVLVSGGWALLILGGYGVYKNALFDLIIASIIACGLLAGTLADQCRALGSRCSVEHVTLLVLFLPLLLEAPMTAYGLRYLPERLQQTEALVAADIGYIAATDGPVLCESLALCYWAGKDIEVDVFNTGQKLQTGLLPESDVTGRFADHYYDLVQMDRRQPAGTTPRWPDSINRALQQHYRIARESSRAGTFLVSREP